jgi:hypothetical protein
MSSSIRPGDFSKYAPRRLREGTASLGETGLPSISRMTPVQMMNEPPWRRSPSPFEGEIPQWRLQPTREPVIPPPAPPLFAFARGHNGLVDGLVSTAAVVSFAMIAIVGVRLVVAPKAPREAYATQTQGTLDASGSHATILSQREKVLSVASASRLGVSDLWPEATPVDSAPVAEPTAPTPAPQISNAMYMVASADPTALPARPRPDQQIGLPQAQQQPQVQPIAQAPAAPAMHADPGLSPADLDRLITRGEAFFDQGDFAAARLLLERAAEARDPRAALALGSTYDPNVLRRMGVVGIRPDEKQAQLWYQRAVDFGSGEAGGRLTALAQLSR